MKDVRAVKDTKQGRSDRWEWHFCSRDSKVNPNIRRKCEIMYISILCPSILSSILFHISPSLAAVQCVNLGAKATANFTNGAGEQCTYTGIVGTNFGINPNTSRVYVRSSSSCLLE